MNIENMLGGSIKADSKIDLEFGIPSFPEGKHKVRFLEANYCPSKMNGMDRTEFIFEVLASNSEEIEIGGKCKIAYFKDKYNIGWKEMVKFIMQTLDIQEIKEYSNRDILQSIEEVKGNVCDVVVRFKRDTEKAKNALEEGKPYRTYSFSPFVG